MPIITIALAIVITTLAFSFPMAWLWNVSFVPAVSVFNEVDWKQMWGMLVFIGVIFFPVRR